MWLCYAMQHRYAMYGDGAIDEAACSTPLPVCAQPTTAIAAHCPPPLAGGVMQRRRGAPAWPALVLAAALLSAWQAAEARNIIEKRSAEGKRYIEDTDKFPGWRGELPQEEGATRGGAAAAVAAAATGDGAVGFGELGQVLPPLFASCRWVPGCAHLPGAPPPFLTPPPKRRAAPQEVWRGRVEQVSWRPRVFSYPGFLTDAECEHLKAVARGRLELFRTAWLTFLNPGEDAVVRAIEKRLELVTMLPAGVCARV